MFNFFKNISEKNSCNLNGACSIHPSISSLYYFLLNEIKEISFYLVKLKELGYTNIQSSGFCIECLSIFLINTSFNQKKYLNLVSKLVLLKNEAKEKYIDLCNNNDFPCEIINTKLNLNDNLNIPDIIKLSQKSIVNNEKNSDKKKQRLFELVTIFARLCSIEIIKIKKYEPDFNDFDYEILRFLALTNTYTVRNEKLIRRIKEFSKIAISIKEKLTQIYNKKYGEKESANPLLTLEEGHNILISGDDLYELEKLLTQIENMKLKEKINVYTNGALFLAHFYPYFKNNKYLKGHFGGDNAEYDFSIFQGSILVTQNFIQKIDSLYRGEIFSSKLISFSKVFDIQKENYAPVIEMALNLQETKENKDKKFFEVKFDKNEIENFIENFSQDEIIIILGKISNKKEIEKYQNKTVLHTRCPLEDEILLNSIKKLQEKNVKITFFIAQCSLYSLYLIFMLLDEKMNLNITSCSHSLINPHVFEALNKDFDVNII